MMSHEHKTNTDEIFTLLCLQVKQTIQMKNLILILPSSLANNRIATLLSE